MYILITGIHGFVGSNLVSGLKEQHTIYGLDIVSPLKDGVMNTFTWNEMNAIPPVDIVIHLAGKAHDTKNQTGAKVYFDINTGLTQRIFDWFLTSGARKFIFFSSVKAATDSMGTAILTEDVAPAPKGPYGESKLAAEQYLITRLQEWTRGSEGERESASAGSATKAQQPGDKKVYILRPCMIHGQGNKGNLNLLFKLQQKGLPWPLGAFENKRSFCSIDNILFVVQQLIDKNIEPGIYQVADDEAISTNELIKLIASSQNKKAKIWSIPVKSIKAIARVGDFLHLPLNSERLRKLTESYLVSNQKIKQALGIDKMPATAIAGLKKTFESFKKSRV